MSEQPTKSAWRQPQNYIIAALLLGIAGYVAYQQLQPKASPLAQASAYFDALEAEERAAAALKQAEQAQAQAEQARRQAEQARVQAENERRQREQQAASHSRALANSWSYRNHSACSRSGSSTSCVVTCANGNGSSRTISGTATQMYDGKWVGYGGVYSSMIGVFMAACTNI